MKAIINMQKPYYEKPKFKLYKADCLNILNSLPENSINMIFANPPYFLSNGSFTCQNGKKVSVKKGDRPEDQCMYVCQPLSEILLEEVKI